MEYQSKTENRHRNEYNRLDPLDFLEDSRVLSDTHTQQLFAAPFFVKSSVSMFAKFLHVGSDKHLAKLNKVTMILIVHLNDTPWIRATANNATIKGFYFLV